MSRKKEFMDLVIISPVIQPCVYGSEINREREAVAFINRDHWCGKRRAWRGIWDRTIDEVFSFSISR